MTRIIILLIIFTSCTPERKDNDVVFQTIDKSLKELLKSDTIALINVGYIEDGYFRKNLKEIKFKSLLQQHEENKNLLNNLFNSIDSSYYVDLSKFGNDRQLMYSYKKFDIDSLLDAGVVVYELGYSKAEVLNNEAMYYVELIDPYHRFQGKGVIFYLFKEKDDWEVKSVIDAWEMRNDSVKFFGSFEY